MDINKVLKIAAICSVEYALLDMFYQCGKGSMLGRMKKYDMTADETLDLLNNCTHYRLGGKTRSKIFVSVATICNE